MRRRTGIAGIGLSVLGALSICCSSTPDRAHRVSATDATARIAAWLDCDECTDEQLGAVVALGGDAVPLLAATLREGLSPAYRARLERELQERYAARRARGAEIAGTGPAFEESEYVAYHVGSWEALHRSRAALALGRIGGEPARQALRAALATAQRPSVEQAIHIALGEP